MPKTLISISRWLCEQVEKLEFGAPVTHVYNPLRYARAPHEFYLQQYGGKPHRTLLMGMNPGPWGMAQTGVPFGEISMVRDWLMVEGGVLSPPISHPKRPIEGFSCKRSEVSGRRLWGWAQERFHTPERFFADFMVLNYCPLVFMEESGKNRTPNKLPAHESKKLTALCDEALRRWVTHENPAMVVGVGKFAEDRARSALKHSHPKLPIGRVLHPSPASPLANKGWAKQAEANLQALGVVEFV